MIKLYILSIIFNLGCGYLAKEKILQDAIENGLEVDKECDKKEKRKSVRFLGIIAVTPLLNILVGFGYIFMVLGFADDIIKEEINKRNNK